MVVGVPGAGKATMGLGVTAAAAKSDCRPASTGVGASPAGVGSSTVDGVAPPSAEIRASGVAWAAEAAARAREPASTGVGACPGGVGSSKVAGVVAAAAGMRTRGVTSRSPEPVLACTSTSQQEVAFH